MSLYGNRKRQREFAEREAAGEDVFSQVLTDRARERIVALLDWHLTPPERRKTATPWVLMAYDNAELLVELYEGAGLDDFKSSRKMTGMTYLPRAIREAPHDLAVSCIEALILALREIDYLSADEAAENIEAGVEEVLREERIAMRLVDGVPVDFSSEELHEEVVAPTLRLLSGKAGWDNVEAAYRKALDEIGADPSDAITDAATALQEALLLLGAEGNALGSLSKSAVKREIITPLDRKVVDWVNAHRGSEGDAHNADPASAEDAWLAVHVVGALILRLSHRSKGASS